MIEPYRMVFVNLAALSAVLFSLFIYKYLFPKKNFNFFLLVIVFSALPLISLFRLGVYESGDFAINVVKSISLYESLSEGIFPVHWAARLNATYGYPLFIFTYPFPYYFIAFLHLIGIGFIASEKIALGTAYLLSGVAMYLFLKNYFNEKIAFAGAVLYQFAPYHLVDLHFRVALGEVFSFTFIPFLLYFLKKLIEQNKFHLLILSSLSFALLILSHQAISLITFPFAIVFILLEGKKIKDVILSFISLSWGLLLSSFYWMPVIFEGQFTYQKIYSQTIYFEPFIHYLFSPFRYGLLFQGPKGELSYLFGYTHLIIFFLSIILILKNKLVKKQRKLAKFSFYSLILLFFLLTNLSKQIWQIIPFINNFQFASRLLVLISFFFAFLGSFTLSKIKSKELLSIIIFLTVFLTILNWGNRAMLIDVDDKNLISRLPTATAEGEGLQPAAPIWANNANSPWFRKIPAFHIKIKNKAAQIKELERSTILHKYLVSSKENVYAMENTAYFPGWNVYINGKRKNIKIGNNGTIIFFVPKGLNTVELKFENTKIRSFSQQISLTSLVAMLLFLSYLLIPHKFK